MPLASAKTTSVRPAAWASSRRGIKATVKAPPVSLSSPLVSPVESPRELAVATNATTDATFMLQMERKAQELCQETRGQYELLLQRQETAHERQLQAARATLQQVLGDSISLADHQQIVASEKEAARRERDELVAQHSRELLQAQRAEAKSVETDKWTRRLQRTQQHLVGKLDALRATCARLEVDKSRVEAALADRERELSSLRGTLRDAEHKQREAEARVEEACRHLASLRSQWGRSDARRRRAEAAVQTAIESTRRAREKLAGKDVAIAEAKGRAEARTAVVKAQLDHTREALEAERAALLALRSEKKELAALALDLQQRTAQLETRERLNKEMRAAERLQFKQQVDKLTGELGAERSAIVKLRDRIEELLDAAGQTQLALQEQRVRLEMQEQHRVAEKQGLVRVVGRHERRAKRLEGQRESLRAEVEELRRGMAEIEAFERSVAARGR